jgi:CRISPR-associated protein Cas5d
MKVERVSYAVMTPSAARGVLEAIFWKPQFHWEVREIAVLRDIQYFSILRNEVNSRASASVGRRILAGERPYYAEDDRAQRNTLALRDVAYVIRAHVKLADGVRDDPAKYRDQFRRRVQHGQCFHRPYLGCREFAASFGPVEGGERPIARSEELGAMLFDLAYRDGRGEPMFFEARLEHGLLRVPPRLYETGG